MGNFAVMGSQPGVSKEEAIASVMQHISAILILNQKQIYQFMYKLATSFKKAAWKLHEFSYVYS